MKRIVGFSLFIFSTLVCAQGIGSQIETRIFDCGSSLISDVPDTEVTVTRGIGVSSVVVKEKKSSRKYNLEYVGRMVTGRYQFRDRQNGVTFYLGSGGRLEMANTAVSCKERF